MVVCQKLYGRQNLAEKKVNGFDLGFGGTYTTQDLFVGFFLYQGIQKKYLHGCNCIPQTPKALLKT